MPRRPRPSATYRRYAALQSELLASVLAARPGDSPLSAIGDPDRVMMVTHLARQLGKSFDEQMADFEILMEAERHRRTIAYTRQSARIVALLLRLLRKSAAQGRPDARATARRLLAEYPTSRMYRNISTLRRRANMARRGLKRLEGEHPGLLGRKAR